MDRKPLYLSVAACVAIGLVWHHGAAMQRHHGFATHRHRVATPALADPEDGAVVDGTFRNEYFGLNFPLPEGWSQGIPGPPPSQTGDYVLSTLVPDGETAGSIVMTAQDLFFAAAPYRDAAAMIEDFRRSTAEIPGMQIDREPSEAEISGKAVHRLDFSGVGLYRATLATDIRCHIVRFNLTARQPEMLEQLVRSLDGLSIAAKPGVAPSDPVCVKDYATTETVLKKVAPVPVGPAFTPIAVRIMIATDGTVKRLHVIRASAEQRRSVEDAVQQWKFRPRLVDGHAVEVETGLLFRFTPRS
jgi:hypothetical protein